MAVKRFRNLHTVRMFISKRLREIEETAAKGDLEAARVCFTGAKLLAELMQKTAIEDRLNSLEKEFRAEREQSQVVTQ